LLLATLVIYGKAFYNNWLKVAKLCQKLGKNGDQPVDLVLFQFLSKNN